ncbi:2-oxoglutarate dehydrogenase complex dihydrolipoyllysine-residue succinyltransferase [Candidatus Methylospira mobilis]|uniref:Dihydrolipoyllysine-residue succinyltransferase component of 2-oxoglutarate dehydrogenase complex n=1 Tax=Candidatus Methylospira mobilis TaxID=1808979 RepID=A0A5Q0BEQ2_9GAMM|nr:2-oxoglutarate dehydrogenase complex dihydrolipoyllysine-residue succinyltransferase [Candidatus Methylospira mobilis]QFY41612.1 2-oxoglutarate dehydrogenase complex dihydrolipoyllysine-residue succinyltransferase [Candidatus Methylospira mobilis]WNV05139.1 2-oxoglutarate dehydrogenase complex dihydrolipoyllysine-residue succinyltransferase [Candidatus Methylospira mobilis]
MQIEIPVPNLPESVQDATLLDWRKAPGDAVAQGETLVELETDKVILDIPAPVSGILKQILRNKGDLVTGGELLGILETSITQNSSLIQNTPVLPETAAPVAAVTTPSHPYKQPVSPAVRRLLTEHGLDPSEIPGSGKEGRLSRQDVMDYLAGRHDPAIAKQNDSAQPENDIQTDNTSTPVQRVAQPRAERRLPMTRLRARIAERMLASRQNTATLTTFNEVSLHRIYELRNLYKTRFEQEHGVKLGFMSFFVKATVEALKRVPIVNASIDGNDLVYHDYYDIGLAVSTERGLVVPVLRDADTLSFGEIEKSVVEFSRKARAGRLSYEELAGGTFSITNGGIFGSMLSTPIINPPQSAILGMHAIKERPVVENGEIVIRPMIYLALSYDHRLIDGRDAVSFLYTIKELLEDPIRMVLHI